MKNAVFIFVILFHINTFSQTIYNDVSFFKKIFSLKMVKRDSVLEKSFNKGKFIFGEATKDSLKSAGDYRNLAVALSYLGEDKNLIKHAIDKAFFLDAEEMLLLYKFLKTNNTIQYKKDLKRFPSIKGKLLKLEEEKKLSNTGGKDIFNFKKYCKKNNLDEILVQLIHSIETNDQIYRDQDYKRKLEKQRKLDSSNLSKIDSLYRDYGTYIGNSLVGDKFSHVMWLVIQHSNIKKMEEYLPILIEAVKNKELKLNPLKMLIDRIHTVKCGNQIFGTQMGVDMAKEKVRKKVIAKYAIDTLE